MPSDVSVFKCNSIEDIQKFISKGLQERVDYLPTSKDALILLKPNLNSDMNALTGNTTDLRIIVSIVKFLKGKGYNDIVIGDGTSSGFYRNSIDVISRLKIENAVKKLGARVLDLNHAPFRDVDFGGGFKARVAKICFDCDFFINIPKLKMHFEVQMSSCLKNLIGCTRGLDKQKVHDDLAINILKLNEKIKADLHIVDGIIAMEGTGPSAGKPAYLGSIVIGLNPFVVDIICAKMIGLNWQEIPYLKLAENMGIITLEQIQAVDGLQVRTWKKLLRPKKNLLVAAAYQPRLRRYLTKIRLSSFGDPIFSLDSISKALLILGLRQDVFSEEDGNIEDIYVNKEICDGCVKICRDYCPMNLDLPNEVGSKMSCVKCLYCFSACPKNAIRVRGDLGFFSEQIKKYGKNIREMISSVYGSKIDSAK